MDRVEATGRTVNEAIENALVRLGASRDQVAIEVISEGSRGILGIGAEDARVSVALAERVPSPSAPLPEGEGSEPAPREGIATSPSSPSPRGRGAGGEGPARPPSGLEPAPRRPMQPLQEELPEAELEEEDADAALAVAGDELVDASVGVLLELLELMHLDGEVEVRSRTYPLTLNVHGDDLGILIGRHGETLGGLQFIVNLIISRRMGRWTRVVVDVEEYRLRRERTLRDVASRAAERVRRTRQTVTLEPMPSNERRIVHLALQGDRFVSTHSIGEGDSRKVVISPRGR